MGGQGQTDVLRLRRELIQAKSQLGDLQEELDEKTNLYMNSIKQRDQYKEKLNNAKQNIAQVEKIVQEKVNRALEKERRELVKLRTENESLENKAKFVGDQNEYLLNEKRQLQDKIDNLQQMNRDLSRTADLKDLMKTLDLLRQEKEEKDKKNVELLHELNNLSGHVENFMAENRALRAMAGVPDNYGINLEEIKLHDREKIDDFKKLIKVLQDDNYRLEEERARLKHAIKVQSMMYKTTNPSERFKDLTKEQLDLLDNFVLRMLQGETATPGDYLSLKRENEQLKAQLEALNTKGFDMISLQIQALLKGKDGLLGNVGMDGNQMQELLSGFESLKLMLQKLGEGGYVCSKCGGSSTGPMTISTNTYDGKYKPPLPHLDPDNSYHYGTSFKFGGSQLPIVDKEGKIGMIESSPHECAFYQAQLCEFIELIKRKDEAMKSQQDEIDTLYKRISSYLVTQDQLYKDYVKVERYYKKKEDDIRQKLRDEENLRMEEQTKNQNLETLIKSLEKGDKESDRGRMIELTKQCSILDVNLLRLTRKYQALHEQEKMLRREYHAKDEDIAEKDLFTQKRINMLKEWKARAMHQLKCLFEKLRMAVPMCEYEEKNKRLEIQQQRNNDFIKRNADLAAMVSDLQKQVRENQEAEEKYKNLEAIKNDIEIELEQVKLQLEHFSPLYKWQNQIFAKIALLLQRASVTPQQAFEQFDSSQDGFLSRAEFTEALEHMKIHDLSLAEIDVIWDCFDYDKSGSIEYKEFARKLERYGVKNRSREEHLIYQMVEAVERSKVKSMADFFEVIDKQGRGFISREDFRDIFDSLDLKIDDKTLENFIGHFWKDRDAGIDYQGFLRIFSRYQVRLKSEHLYKRQKKAVVVPIDVIELKKKVFDDISDAMRTTGVTVRDIFRKIDTDGSHDIGKQELFLMFQKMKLNTKYEFGKDKSDLIFQSMDIDQDGQLSLPEIQSEVQRTNQHSLSDLQTEQKQKEELDAVAGQYGDIMNSTYSQAGAPPKMSSGEFRETQLQTRINILLALQKQQGNRIASLERILGNAESSLSLQMTENERIEKSANNYMTTNFELKQEIIDLKKASENQINRDASEQLVAQNERILTELTETKAAMLSYKNMCEVIADQAKNVKLMHERKKDEHDNLMDALREMQSEGVTQERFGKLYFIIMLSRWQEASVNKKYEAVLSEVKNMRSELLSQSAINQTKDIEIEADENKMNEMNIMLENLRNELASNRGVYLSQNEVGGINQKIQDITDQKTDLEEEHMRLRTQYRENLDKLDSSQAKAENAESLLQQLKYNKGSEISKKLVEMSQKLNEIRLSEFRSKREASELNEQVHYYQRLLKGRIDQLTILEEKASECESKMHLMEENFRKRDNERQRKFFYQDKFNDFDGVNGPGGSHRSPRGGEDPRIQRSATIANRLGRAAQVSDFKTGSNLDENQIARERLIQGEASTHKHLQADWTKKHIAADNAGKVDEMEKTLEALKLELAAKNTKLAQLLKWQLNDNYLTEDEVLKNAIDNHTTKTTVAHEEESEEMRNAACETIKALQAMLDQKNDQIKDRDDKVQQLRDRMKLEKEQDAREINQLQAQLSATGNSTLQKMHEMIHKNNHQTTGRGTQQTNKYDKLSIQTLEKELHSKDALISKLKAQVDGFSRSKEENSKKTQARLAEIDQLKDELRLAKESSDIRATKKELMRLKKERKEQDLQLQILEKSLLKVKDDQAALFSNEINLKEDNQAVTLKARQETATQLKEIKKLKGEFDLAKAATNRVTKENTQLKVDISAIESQFEKLKVEKQETYNKFQEASTNITKERTIKRKLQAELNSLQEEQRIGGNVGGGMTYDALYARNKELEQDNRILEAQRKTVVVYNKHTGTFEYIGEPRSLSYNKPLTSLTEVLEEVKKHFKQNDRITVNAILRSFDRGNFGDLKEEEFVRAFERMGIKFSSSELNLIREKCDPNSTGFYRYDLLTRHLQGIPTQLFIPDSITKLAKLVEARGQDKEKFRGFVDRRSQENFTLDEFKHALVELNRDDFLFGEEDAGKLFLDITKQRRAQPGVKLQMTKLIEETFVAIQAILIERMREQLRRSEKYLVDLLVQHDRNKDGHLEYAEVEALLQEIKFEFYRPEGNQIEFIIKNILDPTSRMKISYEVMNFIIGDGGQSRGAGGISMPSGGGNSLDMEPSSQKAGEESKTDSNVNSLQPEQLKKCRRAARKILINFNGQISEFLIGQDILDEGLLPTDTVRKVLTDRRIPELAPSEVELLMSYSDKKSRGFIVIPSFVAKLQELAKETDTEVILRRFAKQMGNQGINLRVELGKFNTSNDGILDLVRFKRATRQLAVALTDSEIKTLFAEGGHIRLGPGHLDIKHFVNVIEQAYKAKPLPSFMTSAAKTNSKVQTRIGAGSANAMKSGAEGGFENWEVEKKYKRNLEALKQEIDEKNVEIAKEKKRNEDQKSQLRQLEEDKSRIEQMVVGRKSKPPQEMKTESLNQGSLNEIQQLKDEIYHMQEKNSLLEKTIKVDIKAEISQMNQEKELLEEKLKTSQDRLRNKTLQVEQMYGRPMDDLVRREERIHSSAREAEELNEELRQSNQDKKELREALFSMEGRVLDLKFEKENFDLQYARLQKRITDLEQYKLKSSQLSAIQRQKQEAEINEIKDVTAKITSEQLARQPGDSVKLRKKGNAKSQQELEMLVESLRRVIDKQKVEIDSLNRQNDRFNKNHAKGNHEPALRAKVTQLESIIHNYEMQDVNLDEQDQTIKKLIFANSQLREDLKREIERYNLLEGKFRDLLVKYNILTRENDRNKDIMFSVQTGAKLDNYNQFLDDKPNFKGGRPQTQTFSQEKQRRQQQVINHSETHTQHVSTNEGYASDDSLNRYAKEEAGIY